MWSFYTGVVVICKCDHYIQVVIIHRCGRYIQVLYRELRLRDTAVQQPNKKSSLPTTKDVLERMKSQHALPGVILEWRRITNALTKTVFPLQREGVMCRRVAMTRIHPECYTLTATGRVTMHEPSVQNIPRDFEIHMPGESD